jgi:flagellar hook-basal body complex protein FliE
MHISSFAPIIPAAPASITPPQLPVLPSAAGASSSFGDMVNTAINQVEAAHNDASQSVDKFLSGEGGDLHSTILSVQRADLEFEMAMQVRNKVVSAYQEVMKMQI